MHEPPRSETSSPRPRLLLLEAALLLVPALLWGGAFSLAGGLNIGVRYVLPCYALLYVGLGWLVSRRDLRDWRGRTAALLLGALAAVSLAAYPHHLGYFNVLAGGRDGGYRHLVDSNVDWGQELRHLGDYMRRRGIERIGLGYFGHVDPALHGIDYHVPEREIEPGWYAISVNFLVGYPYLAYDHGRLRPIPAGYFAPFAALEPVDTIGGALMIYRLPPAERGRLGR